EANRRWKRREWLPVNVFGQDRCENRLAWLVGSNHYGPPFLLHETPDELRDLICGRIEREMARIEHVDFGFGHVATIGLRFGKLEGQVVLSPEDEQPRLPLAHPSLPLGVGVDVGAVVVEEVALNVGLAGLVEKSKLIGPAIGVITFHLGLAADVACLRRRQRQDIGAKRTSVRRAIAPTGPPRLPTRPP